MLRPWEFQIRIDNNSEMAVYVQIVDAIKEAIENGTLSNDSVLPGSRLLAAQLKVNRATVIKALDTLISQGWLVSRNRKGMFVAATPHTLKEYRSALSGLASGREESRVPDIIFDDGLPDSRMAPITELARAYRQIFSKKGRWQMMGYSHPAENLDFRNAIVQMLNFTRGMKLSADEVFITRGSQMAIYLSAQILLRPGDHIIIENPGYRHAWSAFEHTGAKLLPVAVDEEGLNTDELRGLLAKYKNIQAVYVTPHHQYPTTVTMSLQRRMELIALSNTYGFTIIEDDFDHEFHFGKMPVLPLCSIREAKHYIYIGTLSKIVAPSLRIGFLATSFQHIDKIAKLRKMIDVQGDVIMEQAVLELINDGDIKRHLKRATARYEEKRDYFETLVLKHLGDKVSFVKPGGGLAFWMVPAKPVDILQVNLLLQQQGVRVLSPLKFSYRDAISGFRLGYASLPAQDLEEGLIRISKLL